MSTFVSRSCCALMLCCAAAQVFAQNATTQPAKPKGLSELRESPAAKPEEKESIEALGNRTNLLQNSSFEQGNEDNTSPARWSPIDNLVWKWTTDPDSPGRGKVIKIDTDVVQRQAYDWWIEHYLKGAPLSDAPRKSPTSANQYETIGAYDGGFFMSDFIPIKDGASYKVVLDIKGPGCKVFVKGYDKILPTGFADENPAVQELFRKAKNDPLLDEKGRPIKYRLRYRYSFWFPAGGDSSEWRTYANNMPFTPTGRELTKDVKYIRVMLYPYWPATTYMFDNVRVVEVEPVENKGKPVADEADIDQGKVIR